MDLKFVGYSPRFCGLKGLVQRCDFVGVEVVHYQHNFLGVRIQLVNKLFDDVRKVNLRASINYRINNLQCDKSIGKQLQRPPTAAFWSLAASRCNQRCFGLTIELAVKTISGVLAKDCCLKSFFDKSTTQAKNGRQTHPEKSAFSGSVFS